MKITIKDETAAGDILNKIELQIQSELITVRELITLRVTEEVERFNKGNSKQFNGLVVPEEKETKMNLFKSKQRSLVDPEKQVLIALDAFTKNGFFILIDDNQVENLDDELLLNEDTLISFLKLTALVGG